MFIWVVIAGEAKQSILSLSGEMDCFASLAIDKVVKLDPVHGFAAETTAATVILGASGFEVRIDDPGHRQRDHGGGSVDRPKAVHWGVVGDILIAWVLTIPAAAFIGGVSFLVLWRLFQ